MAQTYTAIGVFDDYTSAERVTRELADAGFERNRIDLRSNFRTGAAGRSGDSPDDRQDGGISGFFRRLFSAGEDTDDYSSHYAEAIRRGSSIVSVTGSQAEIERATTIMNQYGAVDIDRRVATYQETGYQRYQADAPPYSYEEAAQERERYRNRENATAIPVIEEELEVAKRVVRRGGVRVYSRTVEQPVHQDVTLREEHVSVERRPANRPLRPGEGSRLKDQTIEVTEMAEEAVVRKRARVREEVVVGKETTERTERIDDTVRRTEVQVDQFGREDLDEDHAEEFRADFERNYAGAGQPYSYYEPAYRYGYRMASDRAYRGRDWSDVESDLSAAYTREYPQSAWDKVKNAVRYGWDRVTGRRS